MTPALILLALSVLLWQTELWMLSVVLVPAACLVGSLEEIKPRKHIYEIRNL